MTEIAPTKEGLLQLPAPRDCQLPKETVKSLEGLIEDDPLAFTRSSMARIVADGEKRSAQGAAAVLAALDCDSQPEFALTYLFSLIGDLLALTQLRPEISKCVGVEDSDQLLNGAQRSLIHFYLARNYIYSRATGSLDPVESIHAKILFL